MEWGKIDGCSATMKALRSQPLLTLRCLLFSFSIRNVATAGTGGSSVDAAPALPGTHAHVCISVASRFRDLDVVAHVLRTAEGGESDC